MQIERRIGSRLDARHGHHMVEMGVGGENFLDLECLLVRHTQDGPGVVARIDDHATPRAAARKNVAVFLQQTNGQAL